MVRLENPFGRKKRQQAAREKAWEVRRVAQSEALGRLLNEVAAGNPGAIARYQALQEDVDGPTRGGGGARSAEDASYRRGLLNY